MRNNGSKIAIIAIGIIIMISIIAGAIAYLFVATDIFKSDKELFAKYVSQNVEVMKQLMNSDTIITHKNLTNENSYEASAIVNFVHSEGGEVSNPINDLSLQINSQKNKENEYFYMDAQVLFQEEKYIETELIKSKEVAGIRFSDVIKEFVTIKDDQNLEVVANVLGVDIEILKIFIQTMETPEGLIDNIIPEDEIEQLKETYTNIFMKGLNNSTFSKIKKSTITVNSTPIEANAYCAYFTQEQVRHVLIDIFNNIKNDKEILPKLKNILKEVKIETYIDNMIEYISSNENIPEIKITVYEQKGVTVQTVVEVGEFKITIENMQNEEQANMKILIKDESSNEYIIQIKKCNTDNSETYNVTITDMSQEKEWNIMEKMLRESNGITEEIKFEYIEGITTIGLEMNNITKIVENFESKVILEEGNNVVLNDINEKKLSKAVKSLMTRVVNKTKGNINKLQEKIELVNQQKEKDEAENQIEINKFNAKFEFYTGDEVSAENVKTLLDIVKDNLNSIEYITLEQNEEELENENNTEELLNVKLKIERDKENIEIITPVLEKVEDYSTYKVSISYREDNGLVDYITIEENVEE